MILRQWFCDVHRLHFTMDLVQPSRYLDKIVVTSELSFSLFFFPVAFIF